MTLHSTIDAARLAGVTIRQVDYWVRTGVITPTVSARGSGTRRKWSDEDVAALTAMGRVAHALHLEAISEVYRRVGEDARRSPFALVLAALTDLSGRATADEITGHLNRSMDRDWQRSCVSSRLSQLCDPNRFDGAPPVEDSGIRRQSPTTGRPVIVFRTVQR